MPTTQQLRPDPAYASDMVARLELALDAVGLSLNALNHLDADEAARIDTREYVEPLMDAQQAIRRARREVLRPLTPDERQLVLDHYA